MDDFDGSVNGTLEIVTLGCEDDTPLVVKRIHRDILPISSQWKIEILRLFLLHSVPQVSPGLHVPVALPARDVDRLGAQQAPKDFGQREDMLRYLHE